MSRRIEVELTSSKSDGSWTWRAAGARQPKGELDGALLYDGASVGDVVRVDADFDVEGIQVIAVQPPKGKRKPMPELLEIIGPARKEELVTTTLAPRGKGERRPREDRGDRGDRGPRRDGGRGGPGGPGGPRREGQGPRDPQSRPRSDRGGARRDEKGDRPDRRSRPPRPAPEPKPRAKRLKAGRAHRTAVLAALPEVHRPLAEILLRGGIPAVRQAVDRQNQLLTSDGKPVIDPAPLVDLAETLMPAIRSAEWRDKAEAALSDADEIDLRDLRSVVVAADASARDDDTRRLADELRAAVSVRVDREHAAWLAEIAENLDGGRVVRALRLSSRPPKAGAPFPAELAVRLAEATAGSLGAEVGPDRYATVLDALAYSPVRTQVTPEHIPDPVPAELAQAITKLGSRIPQVAARFGIEPSAPTRGPRGGGRPPARSGPKPIPAPPSAAPGAAAPAEPAPAADLATEAAAAPAEPTAPAAPSADSAPNPEPAPAVAPPSEPVVEATPPAEAPEPVAEVAAPDAATAPRVDAEASPEG